MWGIELQRDSELSLKRQLYLFIRNRITGGLLLSGEQLPSTRELAKELGLSRNTVSEAYDMLLAEGFVISQQGAPTRVADDLHLTKSPEQMRQDNTSPVQENLTNFTANFQTGRPDLREFPQFLWQLMLFRAAKEMSLAQYNYSGPQGFS